jgi:GNAT superfamily N-acetyltransferase
MNNLIYRKLEKRDYPDIMEMIDNAWHFDKYTDKPKSKEHMLKAFMRGVLLAQNYNLIAELDGKAVGIICGKIPKLRGFLKNIKHLPSAVYHALCLNFGRDQRRILLGFKDMQMVYARLLKETKTKFGGELEFFVVHSKSQGLGVGKKLLNEYLQYCKEHDVKNIYLYTDVNCNYGFYEHHGFVRQGTLPVTFELYNGKLTYDNFIYSTEVR